SSALDAPRAPRAAQGPAPAAPGRVALYPSIRRCLGRPEPALLRRPTDGSRLPAHLRTGARAPEGNRRQVDSARADLGRGARLPVGSWLLPAADYGSVLPSAVPRCFRSA